MLLLEGIGTVVFGLWVMSQGTEPGASIMIVIGLPIVLFGTVLTFIGFARFLKEKTPDVSVLAREQEVRVRPEPELREQRSRKKACPECGAKYRLFDLVTQPTMCSPCWKKIS